MLVPSANTKKFLEETCQIYERNLPGSEADQYLTNRGITNEVRTYFRLGYVSESDHPSDHDMYVGRLVIPYITPSGIVQMRFRAVPEGGILGNPENSPKYLSEANKPSTIFNTRALSLIAPVLAVCEGELDAITCKVAGIEAIAFPGAKSWDKLYARALHFRNIVILGDSDDKADEGKKFAEAAQKDVRGSRVIMMPSGYDVNSFVVEYGPEALRDRIGLKE